MKNTPSFQKNTPSILNAWASFDWANSVYNLTITAAIFPVYYEAVTRAAFKSEQVIFFGQSIEATALYAYTIGASFFLVAVLSPMLSGIADYAGKKKLLMKIYTYLGASACIGLYFFDGQNIEQGIILAFLASVGYSGSIVFYLSYLPEIATDDRLDSVSARGYSLGFLGSIIHLILCLILINNPTSFGFADIGQATRFSFLLVGIWWIGFSQIAFIYLPQTKKEKDFDGKLFKKGFEELVKVGKQVKQMRNLKIFLIGYFFFNMGVQSILLLATLFGSKELKLPGEKLIFTILLLQLVGIIGAFVAAYVSKHKGNRFTLLAMTVIWIFICLLALRMHTEVEFYLMAVGVGIVMGGFHLARATYAKLIPENTPDTTSFFSFYDMTDKLSTALGPVSYGLLEVLTGSMRGSIIALVLYFIVGLCFLYFVAVPRGEISSQN